MSNDIIEPVRLVVPNKNEFASKDPSEYNELEKSLAGMPYNPFGEDLVKARVYAKIMCRKYNDSDPRNHQARNKILGELFGKFSSGCYIEPPFYCDYGPNIYLEENVYMNHGCIFLDENEIKIGKGTFLAPNVQIYTAGHSVDPILRRGDEFCKPIKIGRDCWIGGNVIILPGITIGDGVTIGAGSVVTKDIESFSVAVGNPARVIKKLEKVDLDK
ncbi:unnamed protein product [Brachionus calyciflorus]|uniref:Maltose/galactoside acetyltransferase domain-containing protein n=1 Tax=Brachionus calyciflorus TaxID=104777 RepID=A0A813ZVC5_9BILA|nr:unnamed protein product [Brachionus calyciflorus]